MTKLYDLSKHGTIIITIGRSGSHLLGDIIEQRLLASNVPVTNLREGLLVNDPSFDANQVIGSLVNKVQKHQGYVILQVQDFVSKLWLLRGNTNWLNDYHVVILKRRNQLNHFFSRQLLSNFWKTIPVHTKRDANEGADVSFNNLKGKQVQVPIDAVWQFYSEQTALNQFDGDEVVYYEDLVDYPESATSLYIKNDYKIDFRDLFTNYDDVAGMLTND